MGSVLRGRQLGVGRDDAHLLLAGQALLAELVPALVVVAPMTGGVLDLGVQRGMDRPVGVVQEERLVGIGGLDVADHAAGPVGEIVGEVVALRVLVDVDGVVALVELVGEVEVGQGLQEPVVLVEPPLQRPRVGVSGHRQIGLQTKMPLAHRHGGVAVGPQHLGQRALVVGQLTGIAGKAGIGVGHKSHARVMGVEPGQQRRPSG